MRCSMFALPLLAGLFLLSGKELDVKGDFKTWKKGIPAGWSFNRWKGFQPLAEMRLVEEDGINFTIATARTPATVVRLLEGVDCRLPLIVMTGAAMWKGGIVDEHYLQASEVESLSALCRKYGVRPFFRRYRRHAIVILLIVAAIITPTSDPFTLSIVFFPLYLLYEFSALLVKKE